jgi:hypothetical protein
MNTPQNNEYGANSGYDEQGQNLRDVVTNGYRQQFQQQQAQDYQNFLQGMQLRNQAYTQRPQGVTQISQAVINRNANYNPANFTQQYQQYQQNQLAQNEQNLQHRNIGLADLISQRFKR